MFDARGNELTGYDLTGAFEEYVDEMYPPARVMGLTFYASEILRESDPVAYRCFMADWTSQALEDGELFESDPTEDEDENEDEDDSL